MSPHETIQREEEDGPHDSDNLLDDDMLIIVLPDDTDIEALAAATEVEEVEEDWEWNFDDQVSVRIPVPQTPEEVFVDAELLDEEQQLEHLSGEIDDELDEELAHDLDLDNGLSLPRVCRLAVWTTLAGLGLLLMVGWSYYTLAVAQRPFHVWHSALRPSGTFGLSLGISGTALMAISLLYLARKYFAGWGLVGNLRSWLGFHVVTGLLGAAFILFHANFLPYSAHGVLAFVALVVVVGSGVLGRYVLAHVPRSLKGRELELEGVQRRLVVYRRKLTLLGVNPSALGLGEDQGPGERARWLLPAIVGVLYGDRQSRDEYRRLASAVSQLDEQGAHTGRILALVKRLSRERQWLARYRELRKIIGAWRFLHRWLAIVMFVAVAYHVGIAVRFGELWIFGGGH